MSTRRRWYQFSLWQLICGAVILGPALGTWIYHERQRPKRAAAAINQLRADGWNVECKWMLDSRGSSWLGRMMGVEPMPYETVVTGDSERVSDEHLNRLRDISGITYLAVDGTRFGDSDCAMLQMADLEELWASNTEITDRSLSLLARKSKLKWLKVRGNMVTDVGMVEIAKMEDLQLLDVSQCDITDNGIRAISGLANLQELIIDDTRVTEHSVQVFYLLPNLRHIRARHCPISREAMWQLTDAKAQKGKVLSFELKEDEVPSLPIN